LAPFTYFAPDAQALTAAASWRGSCVVGFNAGTKRAGEVVFAWPGHKARPLASRERAWRSRPRYRRGTHAGRM